MSLMPRTASVELAVWVLFEIQIDPPMRMTILAALRRIGVAVSEVMAPGEGFGVCICKAIDEKLLTLLRLASRGEAAGAPIVVAALGNERATQEACWHALRAGACDVVRWHEGGDTCQTIRARLERWLEISRLATSLTVRQRLVGSSPRWNTFVHRVVEIASYSTAPVLLLGESGTGKEMVARTIHELDPRPNKAELVTVDCTTLSPELSGSELFGHERGAFTGAQAARDGACALADGGTLFLDEIGELPLPLQAQLLRVIQEGKFKRVGANFWQQTHFRLIAATNRDLEAEVDAGRFRVDLYHRIAGWVCRTLPLRDHPDDIPELALHFLRQFRGAEDCEGFDAAVTQFLCQRPYPGNVRDLRRLVARLCHRHVGPGAVSVGDVPPEERPAGDAASETWDGAAFEAAIRRAIACGVTLKEVERAAKKLAIQFALTQEGSQQRAAERLNVTVRTLQQWREEGA